MLQSNEQKAPINLLPRRKASKTQQVENYEHPRKSSDFSSFHQPGRYIGAGKENFAYISSLQKFPFLSGL